MRYLGFTAGFFVVHLVAYVLAGVVSQTYSARIYHGSGAVLAPVLRDVTETAERRRQGRLMIPAQLARAVLLSIVLWPLLDAMEALAPGLRFAVLFGLAFVWTDLGAATPFPNTIEGWVYLRRELLDRDTVARVASEGLLYALVFAGLGAWLLF
jgi:hypothetical protein